MRITFNDKIRSMRQFEAPWHQVLQEQVEDFTNQGLAGYVFLGLFVLLAPVVLPVILPLALLGWAVAKLLRFRRA